MDFVDSHFHLWNLQGEQNDTGSHAAALLGSVGKEIPIYLPRDYLRHMQETGQNLVAAIHVEALPRNPLQEIKWLLRCCKSTFQETQIGLAVVARVDLSQTSAPLLLKELSYIPEVSLLYAVAMGAVVPSFQPQHKGQY